MITGRLAVTTVDKQDVGTQRLDWTSTKLFLEFLSVDVVYERGNLYSIDLDLESTSILSEIFILREVTRVEPMPSDFSSAYSSAV